MSDDIAAVNAQATTADFEFEALAQAENYRHSLITEFSPYLKGSVLEVGSGIGQFTMELLKVPAIKSVHALEPDPRFYSRLVEKKLGTQCTCGTVADLAPGETYDAIVSVNVLEHIEHHARELASYRERLRPGGSLCLFVPACPSITAPIDKDFGHFRRYTRGELRGLLEQAGLRVEKLHYFNFIGYFAWWFNFCFLKKMHFEPGKVLLYDRRIFPVVHAAESHGLRPPFGQSLLAIAQV